MKEIIDRINEIENEKRRSDMFRLFELINQTIDVEPSLWDRKSIGYGNYHYVNKTNEGDMPILAFVPASAHITIYFTVGGLDPYKDLLDQIGKYKRGKICLYLSNLDKVNDDVLRELIKRYYDDVLENRAVYS